MNIGHGKLNLMKPEGYVCLSVEVFLIDFAVLRGLYLHLKAVIGTMYKNITLPNMFIVWPRLSLITVFGYCRLRRVEFHCLNQSQPIGSINKSINKSINQSINQSISPPVVVRFD